MIFLQNKTIIYILILIITVKSVAFNLIYIYQNMI